MPISNETLSKLRIMLVEDDDFLRNIHTHVLREITTEKIIRAENGTDAIDLLSGNFVDLVITDIQMPEMNGLELIKHIRTGQTAASSAIPIIVVSTYSNTEVITACMKLEINGFLVKPISESVTLEKIKIALSEKLELRNGENYQQVQTDLEVLEESTGKAKPTASANKSGNNIAFYNLKPGMVLAEGIKTRDGLHLLEKGQVLNKNLINRLKELVTVIDEADVWVK